MLDNVYQRLIRRFDAGEFDKGIELFLKGKTVYITLQTEIDGKSLTEQTKDAISRMTPEEGIETFNRIVNEEYKPVKVVEEKKTTPLKPIKKNEK